MIKIKAARIRVFDDGGEDYIDRYTVVYWDGSYIAMSENPLWLLGFCQHGEGLDFKGNLEHLGQEIPFARLPKDCKTVVERELVEFGGEY